MNKESIDAALAAHSQWKKRLQDAIENGKSEFKPEVVKTDNACQFGQWLYSLPTQVQKTSDFIKVKQLHADFHAIAGEILNLAITGKKEIAREKIESGKEYSHATGKLVLALQSWKDKL